MGYSMSVTCSGSSKRDKLVSFLEHNLVPWHKVVQKYYVYDPNYDYTQFVCQGNELSYGPKPNRVGFNFTTQGDAGNYMWAILRWSALRVGRKMSFNKLLGHDTKVPYITYDGYDHVPVLFDMEHPPTQWTVDVHGCRPLYRWWKQDKSIIGSIIAYFAQEEKRLDLQEKLIKAAMQDLSIKWNNNPK